MSSVNLIYPHQLFADSEILQNGFPVYLVEEYLFFRQYDFHKQKLAFHRASMKFYEDFLQERGIEVHYVPASDPHSDVRKLLPWLGEQGISAIHFVDPTDDWLERRIRNGAAAIDLALSMYESPLFLNSREELSSFFRADKKKFFQTQFYIEQRKKRGLLVDAVQNPLGGKWSFDAENRKKYPRKKVPPSVRFPETDPYYEEAKAYVRQHFDACPGELADSPLYPTDYTNSQAWLDQFLRERFAEFGPYEDAIVAQENILHHSVLSPLLNVGLLSPQDIVDQAIDFGEAQNIPLNTVEGFVRQLIGWREFIRGVYEVKGREERTRNFWQFDRKIPPSFYDGTTGIEPVDITIRKVLETGYCHHIERLMVLGNFMLLCEFDPDEVYRWFMELFIDAYDWVMVPNVYGMSQFADGGLMSTKPYISGSNYLRKMSDYPKGDWQETWDALFWRFMHVHRDFFLGNPRLGMLVRSFDKMGTEKREGLLARAEAYLKSLDDRKSRLHQKMNR